MLKCPFKVHFLNIIQYKMFCHISIVCKLQHMSTTSHCRMCLGKLQSHRKLWLGKALPSLPDVLCSHFPSDSCARTGFCQSAVAASLAPLGIHSFFVPQHPSPLLPCGLCLPDPWFDPEEEQISQSNQKCLPFAGILSNIFQEQQILQC